MGPSTYCPMLEVHSRVKLCSTSTSRVDLRVQLNFVVVPLISALVAARGSNVPTGLQSVGSRGGCSLRGSRSGTGVVNRLLRRYMGHWAGL